MTDPVQPPKNKRELFERLTEIVQHGPYTMPDKRYAGTGAPGIFVEDLLGLTTGNKDIPDSLGWELKFYSNKTNLITLFQKKRQIWPTPLLFLFNMRQMLPKRAGLFQARTTHY